MDYKNELGNWEEIILEPSGDTLPIGAITQFSGSVAPTNWLICNGQAISRTTYSELFSVIGTTYGEGDGSTTFNVPDFSSRVPQGIGEGTDENGVTKNTTLGQTYGEYKHKLTIDEMPTHSHGLPNVFGNFTGGVFNQPTGTFQWHNQATSTYNAGGDQSHSIMQPILGVNFIIKVKQSVGIVGTVTNDMTNQNTDSVPSTPTVKNYIDGIVESGNDYTKYADGTLICYGKSETAEIPYGSEYSENVTLPESYKDSNFIVNVSITSGGASWANIVCRGGATSENTIRLIAGNYIVSGSTARNIVLSYIAIGKWK